MVGKISYNKPGNRILFYGWVLLAYILILILMILSIKICFPGKELTEKATESGQIAIITIATGKVEGNVKLSQKKSQSRLLSAQTDDHAFNQIISKEGLNPAPNPDLTEQIDKLPIPVTGKDGTLPWKYYGRPYEAKEKRNQIAIVFTNLGLSKPLTEESVKLPHDITLGFSPYAADAGKYSASAREMGFESVIDLPMQTENYPASDPGPFGLMEDLSAEDNITRIYTVISLLPAPVGVIASLGEKMTANIELIKPYLIELKKRGLLFIYIKNAKNKELEEQTKSFSPYIIGIDTIIDEDITRSAIETSLNNLVTTAQANGYAVGLAHAYPPTLETLANWSNTLKAQNIDLVPISAIGKRLYP